MTTFKIPKPSPGAAASPGEVSSPSRADAASEKEPCLKSKINAKSRVQRSSKRQTPDEAFELPVYSSIRQAVVMTGIPKAAFYQAKKDGCEGFIHSKVYLAQFLKWWFSQQVDVELGKDWSRELRRVQAMREQIRLDADKGAMVQRAEVIDVIRGGVAILFAELSQTFCNELPPVLKGLAEPEIRIKCLAMIELLKDRLRSQFEKFENE